MNCVKIGSATLYHGDSLAAMREMPDNAFSLAIVDPPYGLGSKITAGGTWSAKYEAKGHTWDIVPSEEYFRELARVSCNQIIWGANYVKMRPCRGFIVWDKGGSFQGHTFAECEYAWTSFDRNAVILKVNQYTGFLATGDDKRIHATQKPISLYKRLLLDFAKPGDTILDTHSGSGSSSIAAIDMGYPITAYEIDADYFKAACERIERSQLQQKLF